MALRVITYYAYVLALTIIFIIVGLLLIPFAPINEPTHFPGYNLQIPVGLSFSAFVFLMVFIVTVVLFWGTKNTLLNIIIDSSALTFIVLNYLNFYLVFSIWKPSVTLLPFFILVKYDGVSNLTFDFGQVVLIISLYRLYKNLARKTY